MSESAFQASQPDASAWVGANAGAGKTYILVSRLVRLMLSGVAPEKLLCLTYTRSAAAEMQERLFDLLGEWALLDDAGLRTTIGERLGADVVPDDLAMARILFARALETPGGLRVQTIHAFCESLLKRFPLEAGLSPQFDLMDEQDMQDLQFELVAGLIRTPPDNALGTAMSRLSRALNENDLLQLGRLILDRRSAFAGLDTKTHLANLAHKTGLTAPGGTLLEPDALMQEARLGVMPEAGALAAWLAEGTKTDQARSGALLAWHELAQHVAAGELAESAQWQALEPIFLTEGRVRQRLATTAISAANPVLAQHMGELGALVESQAMRLRARAGYDLTAALLHFGTALIAAYEDAKAARAVLDYDDLIATTNQLLSGHRAAQWVLFKIDSGLAHILVDEAQDTSPAQWRLIRALADEFFTGEAAHDTPRTLFAVGDEKQSIFSFQGADPREFDKQRRHFDAAITAIGGRFNHVYLNRSRRSTPQVLQLVDALFGDEAARAGVSLEPVTHIAHRLEAVGHVELWPLEKPQNKAAQSDLWDVPDQAASGDAAQRLAGRISDKIAALISDKSQNISAGDILILVRKRDGFVDEMMRALKRRDIQVAGADRMVLLEQMVIMDILAAADFALNSEDDLTLACLLKSPLCGLDEDALFELAHGRKGSLWQALRERAPHEAQLQFAHERLLWMRRTIDYISPFDWLSQLLAAQGGHGDLRAQLGAEIDDPVAELLRLALAYEMRHVASMQGFLHWLRHGQQEIKRDMEGRGAAVRIMTVHGAKGLEAPIVFLPDTCRPPVKSGGRSDAMQFDEDGLPLWRATKLMRDAYGASRVAAAEEMAAQEEKRLLYVALTRARDRLYIGGYVTGRKTHPVNCWYDSLARAFDVAPDGDAIALWPGSAEQALAREEEAVQAPDALPDMPDWLPAKPPPLAATAFVGDKIFSPSGLASFEVGDLTVLHSESDKGGEGGEMSADELARKAELLAAAAERGRLVHKLLQSLPTLEAAARREAGLAFLARQPAESFMAAAPARAALMDEVEALMALPEMQDVFLPAARAEAPIAGYLPLDNGGHLALSGQIDRYVETATEIILVDFKTGHRPDLMASGYVLQMAAYAALMRAARPDKPVRCGLVWTRSGAIDWLAQSELEGALADILSGRRKLA